MTTPNSDELVLGDFRIERRLGSGGMGIVFQARQISLNRIVALKILGNSLIRGDAIARFQREAQAVAKLKHPGIASIYFVGQDEETCYMAMEYIDGISLRQFINSIAATTAAEPEDAIGNVAPQASSLAHVQRFDEPATPGNTSAVPTPFDGSPSVAARATRSNLTHVRRCCEIVRDAALALEHAHEKGVVHRDIKPDNIMLDRNGAVHVIDFGIARTFDDCTLTGTGQLVGTPAYMSPEQIVGKLDVDQRTDVYSLGMVLYELLVLEPAVSAPSRETVLRQILMKPLVPVSWRNEGVPKGVEAIVHKAAARDADDRYATAGGMADDLGRFLAGKTPVARPYRFRSDESEIIASRPAAVVVLGFILAGYATILFAIFVVSIVASRESPHDPISLSAFYAAVMTIFAGLARGIMKGRRASYWLAQTTVILSMADVTMQVLKRPSLLLSVEVTVVAFPILATILVLCSNGVRRWFRFAHEQRLSMPKSLSA